MENKLDFTQGKILPKLVGFILPVLFALILQALYGTVDTIIVGQYGSAAAISGVTTGANIVNMFVFTLVSFGTSITVLISRYIGAKQNHRISKVIGAGIALYLIFTAVVSIACLVFAPALARLMNTPTEAYDLTVQYIRICGGGSIFTIACNFITAIFRGDGDSKLPLLFVGIACVVNIILDLLFIVVFKWDVMGAATATVIAQFVSFVLSIVIIKHKDLPFSFSLKDIGFNEETKDIIRIGWPIGLQELLTSVSFSALNAFINGLGLDCSNGYGIANRVTQFVMLIPISLLHSMSAFIGQNVGANKEDRCVKSMLVGTGIGCSIGLFAALAVFFFGYPISHFFSQDTAALEMSALFLKGFALEGVFTGPLFCFMGYFNAHNKTTWTMFQSILQTFLVRLPISYLFSIAENASMFKIGLALPLSTLFGILVNALYFAIFYRNLTNNINSNINCDKI